MNFTSIVTILAALVTIAGGIAAVTRYVLRQREQAKTIVIITSSLLLIIVVVTGLLSQLGGKAGGQTVAGNNPTSTSDAAGTTSIPSPTVAPTATQVSAPAPGTVVYQAHWSNGMDGWVGNSDWQVLNGMLVNTGKPEGGDPPTVLAPYPPQTRNYAIEAQVQYVADQYGYYDFAFYVRSPEAGQGYDAEISWERGATLCIDFCGDPLRQAPFNPGSRWHTYRVEAKDNTIRLLIDGGVVFSASSLTYLDPGRIGLYSNGSQLNIRSFKVIAL
jgi:hypothetical protein